MIKKNFHVDCLTLQFHNHIRKKPKILQKYSIHIYLLMPKKAAPKSQISLWNTGYETEAYNFVK